MKTHQGDRGRRTCMSKLYILYTFLLSVALQCGHMAFVSVSTLRPFFRIRPIRHSACLVSLPLVWLSACPCPSFSLFAPVFVVSGASFPRLPAPGPVVAFCVRWAYTLPLVLL